MSGAIQRWYVGEDGSEQQADSMDVIEQLWCKAKDVIQLEQLLSQYLETIDRLRENCRQLLPALQTAEERVMLLEQKARILEQERDTREQLRSATQWYKFLQGRYDAIMARTRQPEREPSCCDDFPECFHGR
jgi:hypothetical protein